MTTVLSAIYGGYDTPKRTRPDEADRWVMVTDSDDTAAAAEAVGWEPLVIPSPFASRLAAQQPKCQPHIYVQDDVVVWADGGLTLHAGTIAWATSHLGTSDWLAMFAHPSRDCVYTEAAFSATRPKYHAGRLGQQSEQYRSEGHPARWGLWCGGFFAVRLCPAQACFGAAWFSETAKWETNDQLALSRTLHRLHHRPVEFNGHLYASNKFRLTDHG